MPLKAKPPEVIEKRLKLFLWGVSGIGKTTACCQLPKPYIIDGERGTENYTDLIRSVGGAVLQTTDMDEVLDQVKALMTEKHDYKTLVIDPLTPIYNALVDKCEIKIGSEFGRHIAAANKVMKRLINLIMALDMNVVISAHAKKEYGNNLAVLGMTFDCYRALDYIFDLVIQLERRGKKRYGKVIKTRLASFPEDDSFEWNYDVLKQRCGDVLDRQAAIVNLASPAQVTELKSLLELVRLPDGTTEKWLSKAGVETFEDMPAEVISRCIAFVQNRLPNRAPEAELVGAQ